jgi:SWI/SNF-related matrix-associated actin-dependent regulator 1 of chromatin subfamily A
MTSIYFKDKEMAKNETKVNEIIELNDSPIKSHNNNDMEVIEVEETPEIKMKRFSRMSSTLSPNDDSFDSPLNLPKKLNKRIFFDDEEEEDNGRNHKRQALHQYETNDEIGRIAFENMCESAIKELMDLFPEIDVCEIQDALLETNWSVFNASIKLGNLCNKNEEEVTIVSNNNLSNNSNKSKSNAINANNSNERMKSLDYYRKNVSKNFQNNKSNSSIASTSNCFIKSIKNNKNQFNKRFKEKDYENDNEKALSSDGEDSDEEYDKEDIVCISSNDDSEDDSKSYKVNKSSKTQLRVSDLRSKVVTFLQEANSFELQTIPGVSGKKIDLIINLRPFIDWNDCVFKFDNHTNLSTDILNNCCATLKARETVERLMNSCEEISRELTQTVDKLSALKQPNILNKQMKLSNYQLIGLNWLALMYKKGLNCILADEMGLGKTIQVIAFFAYLREMLNITGPHLVIVPSSTLDNWSREVIIFLID